jgi:hypothetical protein
MPIDINQLDKIDPESERAEEAMEKFGDAILQQFHDSPEGKARLQIDPGMGFWATQLIDYGYSYVGVTLSKMRLRDVKQLLMSVFPRKISFASPDDLDDTIPELTAFWKYLKREYQVEAADEILLFLQTAEPEFKKGMADPSLFGMAKSFFMSGRSRGYDMTSETDMQAFGLEYNAQLAQPRPSAGEFFNDAEMEFSPPDPLFGGRSGLPRQQARKKNNRRKMEKASRKKNRKKRN